MNKIISIMAGALTIVLFAFIIIVVTPNVDLANAEPTPGLKPYSPEAQRGREVYINLGCMHCHTQQVRDDTWSTDSLNGWGRPSKPGDYFYDKPHLLGTMRTGPDLADVGSRQPGEVWHLIHLYQPRAVVADSIMPSYPFLFEEVEQPSAEDKVVPVPPDFRPENKQIVTKQMADDLVAYLLALKQPNE